MRALKTSLLATSTLAGVAALLSAAALPSLAFAQDVPPEAPDATADMTTADDPAAPAFPDATGQTAVEVEGLIVTGSRIPRTEFTSASPIQVLTTGRADVKGLADTAQFLQNSTLAAGSPQVNAAISSAFVTDGGPGASTVSLRGLGANRTLVLINGRRAGPAGTRGGVSSVDLNVIPQSAIERADILKDGASSIYGSDAVAGVINLITKANRDGGEISAFYTAPFEGGGEQMNFAANWGKRFERGWFGVSGDYYKHYELQEGDRDYTQCAAQYLFHPKTHARTDRVDPRTGKPACLDTLWGHVWIYGADFSTRQGRYQFDYDGDLGNYIPPLPGGGVRDGVCPAPPARHTDPDCYPVAPNDFFLVGQDPESTAVMNANHPLQDQQSLIPEIERATVLLEGAFEITPDIEAYGEVLLNRRESRTNGYRQYWTYNYTSNWDFFYGLDGGGGDPFSVGWTGPFVLSPTPHTDHFDAEQKVDYTRYVLGLRGDLPGTWLPGWKWDLFGQYSKSDGDYIQDVILDDAIWSQNFRYASCVGDTLPISGRDCIDINFTDPRILAGDLTAEERAFLFDVDQGNTIYEQSFVEGSIAGDLFDMPAGPFGVALGFHYREDEINDVPGPITREGNSWGLSSAGITAGSDTTREVFGELAIPIVRDMRLAQNLDLSLSGRYTDVESSGSATTYKAGLNWQMTPEYKLRLTHGTSFRAPALFELYLAEQSSFPSQRSVDPCINWGFNLAQGIITQQLADNCANPAGPGGGVPSTHTGAGSAATLFEGGGLGLLEPETSKATTIGFVWTPSFADLSVALDYFEITVEDEVVSLGTSIPSACYTSDNFPNDPICGFFDRNPGTNRIDEIRSDFINISEQQNRGIDLTFRYRTPAPMALGDLIIDGQFTWQLEDYIALFADQFVETNNDIGDPGFVGNINAQLARGPWTGFWGVDIVGPQNDYGNYGSKFITISGVQHQVKANAELTIFHTASVQYEGPDWTALIGVANLFDEHPPAVTTVSSGLGEYNTVGVSVFASQYTEAYYGRRGFIRLSKRF